MATTSSALDTQIRVILALALREVHTMYGGKTLGYLWAIVQASISVAIFWAIRYFAHAAAPHGMTMLAYLVSGFGIWNIISQCLSKCMVAVEANSALLTFPQVTPLDVMLGRCLVVTSTQVVTMSILLTIGAIFGFKVTISSLALLMFCVFTAASIGLGFGCLLGALSIYLPVIQQLVPIIMRILFFASGIFFSVSTFSHRIGDFLMLNPIMQLIELSRMAFSKSYVSKDADIWYVLIVASTGLLLGLLLEHYVRRKVAQ